MSVQMSLLLVFITFSRASVKLSENSKLITDEKTKAFLFSTSLIEASGGFNDQVDSRTRMKHVSVKLISDA